MSAPGSAPRIGIALIAGATLLAELILTRILSAGLFHHLAFLVLSTAMLGTGVAGVWVSAREGRGAALSEAVPARAALLFALGLPVCFSLAQGLGAEPLRVAAEPAAQLVRVGLTYALLAVPFFGAGLAIAALLTRYGPDAPRMYGADLLGAAAGSLFALLAVPLAKGQDALLIASALGAAAAWVLAAPGSSLRRAAAAVAVLLGLTSGARLVAAGPAWLPLHVSASKTTRGGEPFADVLKDPRRTLETTWTTGARVDRVRFSRAVERLVLDAGVAAVRVPPPGFAPGASDSSLPYELRPGARVLIIGSGAGWEVAEALAFGAAEVHAVELNPAVAAAVPKALAEDPRVTLVVDEGRSFAERGAGPYDAVVMVHTISNAASAAGALHLAEDHLFTVEAFERLFALLEPRGLLFVTRPEAQLPRLLAALGAASEARPLAPRVALWAERSAGQSFYGAALASPSALSQADLQRVTARIGERRGLRLLAHPGGPPLDPLLGALLSEPPDIARAEQISGLVLRPPTDDRPFFHQRRRLSELGLHDLRAALTASARARMALEEQPLAELSSLMVLLETVLVGAIALLIPVWRSRRRGDAPVPGRARALLYFGALGLGFMLVEVSLIQRLRLLLGAPALAFAVVFTGLLVGAGAGSLNAARAKRPERAPLYAAALVAALALILPLVTAAALGAPGGVRVALALSLSFGLGFALGAPFPLALARLRPALVPWAFAVNAFTSVAATVCGLLLAAELGFTAVTVVAAATYGLAALTFPPGPENDAASSV